MAIYTAGDLINAMDRAHGSHARTSGPGWLAQCARLADTMRSLMTIDETRQENSMLHYGPPGSLHDLQSEIRHGRRTRRQSDLPDRSFRVYDDLTPDPLFMGLRSIWSRGPIGYLRGRIERWLEEREDGRLAENDPPPVTIASDSHPCTHIAADAHREDARAA